MICKKCGNKISNNAKFCGKCGWSTKENYISENTSKNIKLNGKDNKDGKNNYIVFSVIGILAIVVTIGLVIKWFGNSSMSETSTFENESKDNFESDKIIQNSEGNNKVQDNDKDMTSEIDQSTNSKDKSSSENKDIDVESEVQLIRNKYNSIQDKIEKGKYQSIDMGNGILHYVKGGDIKAIVANTGEDYVKYYYFEKNTLFFAYYEGTDAYRFYFSDGSLIRWRYTGDATDIDNAIDHDLENNDEFFEWENTVWSQAKKYKNMEKKSDSNKVKAVTKENVKSITASSALSEKDMTHSAKRIWDGSLDKAWVEGVDGQGIGEYVFVKFDKKCLVSGIQLNAGYQKSENLYYKNSRPSEIGLEFSDGSYYTCELDDVYGKQTIQLPDSVVTKSLRIVIKDVYEGDKYSDTVVSEMEVY